MKKILILGASGMIGSEVLKHCLNSDEVGEVISLVRRQSNISHVKYEEIIANDFLDYSTIAEKLENVSTTFFCVGVYTGAVSKEELKLITVDYTEVIAKIVREKSPSSHFCFLSGAGADLTEKSRTSFARFKGMAENILLRRQFEKLTIFRPAYIYPVVKRKEPNLMYSISRSLYPLIKLFGKNASITSSELAEAMFLTLSQQPPKEILENKDILHYLETAKMA